MNIQSAVCSCTYKGDVKLICKSCLYITSLNISSTQTNLLRYGPINTGFIRMHPKETKIDRFTVYDVHEDDFGMVVTELGVLKIV